MSRQKEIVTSIHLPSVVILDKSMFEAFITLLQAQGQTVSVRELDICYAELGEEDWQALAEALKDKTKKIGWVHIGEQDLTDVMRDIIKDIWDSRTFVHFVNFAVDSQTESEGEDGAEEETGEDTDDDEEDDEDSEEDTEVDGEEEESGDVGHNGEDGDEEEI